MEKNKKGIVAFFLLLVLLDGFSSASAASPSMLPGRHQVKFESGYNVETILDGSKLGMEPFSVEVGPSGELLVLDSVNSNLYRVSLPLSRFSRPKLVAGSAGGYTGHVDGKPREARLNHPTGFAVDDRGNIYVADTSNMAIRKISHRGVSTIVGGNWNRGGHMDGPSEDAKLSDEFEVVYVASRCSLLVVDRGNQAIREIQLHYDDCSYQYGISYTLGIAMLLAAGFFGYMLTSLQNRVGGMVSSEHESSTISPSPYQKIIAPSPRPPLILNDDVQENIRKEGLIFGAKSFISERFSGSRKKPKTNQYPSHYNDQQHQQWTNSQPIQESFEIQAEDEPPSLLETRTSNPRKKYAFMSKDPEKTHHLRRKKGNSNGWDGGDEHMHQKHVQHNRQHSVGLQTRYEQSCNNTNGVVFGAVQELDSK